MTVRSLYDIHKSGSSDDREVVEQFATQWHNGEWKVAEEHWASLVHMLLNGKDMEALSATEALRRAEAEILDLLAVSVPQPGSRCPSCVRA